MERHHFETELAALRNQLLTMGGLVEERVHRAIQSLIHRKEEEARRIIATDKEINDLQIDIDERCLKLLATQTPLAVDLRLITSAMKINADPKTIVSSGPFVVESATPGERIDFARNPHYYKKDSKGTQLPYLDGLSIEIIPDANNTLVRLQQGTLDFATLSQRFRLSGGYIRNAALRAAFLAAEEGVALTHEHLERAIRMEFREIGKLAETGTLE